MKVSCVIPSHNEEGNLKKTISEVISVLNSYERTKDFEIVIVNDNSTDDTREIAEELSKKYPFIKVVNRSKDPGFGKAIKAGLEQASGDILIPVMADLSDEIHTIPKMVKKIEEGYDVVYGSRFIKEGETKGYPKLKMLSNRLFNNTARFLFGMKHKDISNAFKAYHRRVIDSIGIENLESESFDLTVEIPLQAHILGFKSVEIPTTWMGREAGESKLDLGGNAPLYFKRLMKLFFWGNLVALKDLFKEVTRGSHLRTAIAGILGVLILLGLFTFSGFTEVFSILSQATIPYIGLALVFLFFSFAFRTWRWSVLLRATNHRARRDTLFRCIMFGWFLNYLLPARLGDIGRCFALKTTEDKPASVGFATIAVERFLDVTFLTLLFTLAIFYTDLSQFRIVTYLAFGVMGLLLVGIIFLYYSDIFLKWKIFSRFERLKDVINNMKNSIKRISQDPFSLLLSFALTLPIWILEASSIYWISLSLNHPLPFPTAVISGISAFIMQALPITPAGIGVHEGTIAGVLGVFGVSVDVGTAIALLDHFTRAALIYVLGIISTVHIAFKSRWYFADEEKD